MNQSPQSTDRVIRMFISSTFLDMQDERDILVKKVFPQLRKMCEERAVTWTEVDWTQPEFFACGLSQRMNHSRALISLRMS